MRVARELVDAFNRRDLDSAVALSTPDCVWLPVVSGSVGAPPYRGPEGFERYLRDLDATWDEFEVVADDYRESGDRVLALGRMRMRRKGDEETLDQELAVLFEIREGKIDWLTSFPAHQAGLAAIEEAPA